MATAAEKGKAKADAAQGTTLFVTKLPFEATSTDLETFFSSVGPLRRAFVVTDPVTRFSKGIGYVTFALPEDAQTAIKTLQGAKMQGGAKQAKSIRIEVAKQRESLKERKRKRDDSASAVKEKAPRPLPKDKRAKVDTAEQAAVEEEKSDDEGIEANDDDDDDDDAELDDHDDSDGTDDSEEDEDEEDDDDQDDDDEAETAPTQKPALPTPSEGTTLFIRNLSFTTSEADFRSLFARFGALRYAKITVDKATGRSRGTGFVCFWNKADADRVLEAARRVEGGVGGTGANAISASSSSSRPNPFSLSASSSSLLPQGVQSVLTADPSAPLASTLTLHGRLLSVVPAVERATADKLGSAALKDRQKADKRNTYLMREGVPLPNASLTGTCLTSISDKDKERRLDEFGRRKSQLERNPSLFVSKTRLSVRQLPLFVTSKTLKRLAIHAVKSFKAEVKEGSRPTLDEDELADNTKSPTLNLAAAAGDNGAGPSRKARKQIERPTAVIQAKVVRQTDRIDPLTGEGRSRGYGFLEMRSFQDALRVVRWANARKEAGNLMREWWCEELERTIETLKKDKKTAGKEGKDGGLAEEDRATRISRLENKVKDLKAGVVDKAERGGGTIAIEFSIENAVVTKKRRDRFTAVRSGPRDAPGGRDQASSSGDRRSSDQRSRNGREDSRDRRGRDDRNNKPQRRENWNQKTKATFKPQSSSSASNAKADRAMGTANRKASEGVKQKEKSGKVVGNIIGKKRKERKEKRKS
ncbi:RNA recognition motif-containing protein [Tilletia horrida]|nr:RNA recognition motif-containing protein [Tilletia horrida]